MSDNQSDLPKYSYFFFILALFSWITISATGLKPIEDEIGLYTSNCPFEMEEIDVPQFPDKSFVITQYGAVGDGHTTNTQVFANVIKACADAGGGRVVVPPGIWLTGPIQLESNINLHIQKGALILFSDQFDDYPLIQTSWEGLNTVRCMSPIYANNCTNIAVTGHGIIDGSGHVWRPVKKFKMTEHQWKELITSGGVVNKRGNIWWPSDQALNGANIMEALNNREDITLDDYAVIREYLRPVMVSLVQCKNILVDGPTFQNSPAWNIHPLMCQNMIIRNINVRNPWYSQNGDGLDLESCKNVVVYDCCFDVGDDAICMKSGKNEQGRLRGIPSENIIIVDCTVYHGHGGFTIGSEMSGGIRNISIRNCTFLGTDTGLRFKSTRGRGGVVENIFIENILMKDIPTDAIRFNMYYNYQAPIPEDNSTDIVNSKPPQSNFPVNETTPSFRNIFLKDIICSGARRAVLLQGLPEMPIQNIEMKDILISAKSGFTCIDADQIILTNIRILSEDVPVYTFRNSRNIILKDVSFPDEDALFIKLEGSKTEHIHLHDIKGSQIKNKIQLSKEVKPDVVVIK